QDGVVVHRLQWRARWLQHTGQLEFWNSGLKHARSGRSRSALAAEQKHGGSRTRRVADEQRDQVGAGDALRDLEAAKTPQPHDRRTVRNVERGLVQDGAD